MTRANITRVKKEILQYMDPNGFISWSSKDKKYVILGTSIPKKGLVVCPNCKTGELLIIRSPKTKKRFIGCSNFYNGCNTSSPLLQKARLRGTKSPCEICKWPMIIFRYSKKEKWNKQCSNIKCKNHNA